MIMRRAGVVGGLFIALLVGFAPNAGADPARPSNFQSRVEWIKPATNAIDVRVVGGDGFLELNVQRGHKVAIPGYTGEPWLRVNAHGVVEENRASSATYLNESRYGTSGNTEIPADVTIENATKHPKWKVVGHNGHYVWHDHRIHYMDPNAPPPRVPGTNRVAIGERNDGRWVIPITVDGTPTQIVGELVVKTAPNTIVPWLLVVAIALVLGVIGVAFRARATRVGAASLTIAGAFAVRAGVSEYAAVPVLAGGNPIWVALPAVSVVVALGALALRGNTARSILVLLSAAALGVWAVLRVPAFGKAVPLGTMNPTLTRFIAAGSLGTAIGAIILVVASGSLALRLDEFDDPEPQADSVLPGD